MAKSKRKEFEAWANKQLAALQKTLLLDAYTLRPIEPSERPASLCEFRYPYKDINISYSEQVIEDWLKGDKAGALETLTHEMCHPLTDALYSKSLDRHCSKQEIEDEREALTDHIANIVIKLTQCKK